MRLDIPARSPAMPNKSSEGYGQEESDNSGIFDDPSYDPREEGRPRRDPLEWGCEEEMCSSDLEVIEDDLIHAEGGVLEPHNEDELTPEVLAAYRKHPFSEGR